MVVGKVGFLGGGVMGGAIIQGIIDSGRLPSSDLWVSGRTTASLDKLKASTGCNTTTINAEVVSQCRIVFIALKPQVIPRVLPELKDLWTPNHVIVSVASGVDIKTLGALTNNHPNIIRVMPNTPATVRAGVFSVTPSPTVPPTATDEVDALLQPLGITVRVEEWQIPAVIGCAGSAPAYVFAFIEALADGGVQQGLPRAIALQCAAQTVMGAAKMQIATGTHPGVLKDQVCSPGGNTIAAVAALEDKGFRGAVMQACGAAANHVFRPSTG
eukprot:TRINITY_DN58865_c0_g1_i1.p1 TRINITY_DN58865_c0_g1~~TRINITY_DN58865_c0_g1_i1.p1  ORF type:complete len:271 (+),score=32.72 TRINITY_DN58865_c0_g1_i1:47-859(+)